MDLAAIRLQPLTPKSYSNLLRYTKTPSEEAKTFLFFVKLLSGLTRPTPKKSQLLPISGTIPEISWISPRLISHGLALSRSTYYSRIMEDKSSGPLAGHSAPISSLKASITAPAEFTIHLADR